MFVLLISAFLKVARSSEVNVENLLRGESRQTLFRPPRAGSAINCGRCHILGRGHHSWHDRRRGPPWTFDRLQRCYGDPDVRAVRERIGPPCPVVRLSPGRRPRALRRFLVRGSVPQAYVHIRSRDLPARGRTDRRGVDTVKFAMACYGSRGDVEPSVTVGRELVRRGHDVGIAVPPDLVSFAEAAGLTTVPYGPMVEDLLNHDSVRNFWSGFFRNPAATLRDIWAPIAEHWHDASATLVRLADGADLLSTGLNFEQAAANVAEFYGIPLVALHHFPMRANGKLIPALPPMVVRSGGVLSEWLFWRTTREVEDAQRHQLGLPKATTRSPRRLAENGSLEIQAYDAACVPGLEREWAKWSKQRPFVGALTLESETKADDAVAAWIADGTPPICFATGSIPVESPTELIEMISAACAELGERALVCFGGTDFSGVPEFEHVKMVGAANYREVFPACRAVVHHGGSGTTAASLRAGRPVLILWSSADQPYWGNQVKRLKVGSARRFSAVSRKSLVADLRRILAPDYAVRAREFAARVTPTSESVAKTADLFEAAAAR